MDRHDVRMRSPWRAAGAGVLLSALAACGSGAGTSVASLDAIHVPPTTATGHNGTLLPTNLGRPQMPPPRARPGSTGDSGGGASIAGCPRFATNNPRRQD